MKIKIEKNRSGRVTCKGGSFLVGPDSTIDVPDDVGKSLLGIPGFTRVPLPTDPVKEDDEPEMPDDTELEDEPEEEAPSPPPKKAVPKGKKRGVNNA